MKTDINGVPWTYENKDILAFDEPTIENNHTDLLDRLKEEKELIEWMKQCMETELSLKIV